MRGEFYFVWVDDVHLISSLANCGDLRSTKQRNSSCCENLNIIELGNVQPTHKSNPNCGYRLLYSFF